MSSYGNPPENPYGQNPSGQNPYGDQGGDQTNPYGQSGEQPTQPYGQQPTDPYAGGYGGAYGGDGGQQGGYPAYGGGGYGGGPAIAGTSQKGFFASLFDFSFSSFITPRVVKAVYALAVGLLTLMWVFFTLVTFTQDAAGGLGLLIFGPVVLLLYFCLIRMTLEFYVAVVRMSEDIHQRLR